MTTSTVPVMTFEEFQKTRRFCSDLPAALNMESDCVTRTGFLYLGTDTELGILNIEILDETTKPEIRAQGSFHLLIGRETEVGFDLTKFERELYDFAVADGYIAEPGDR